MNLRHEKEDQIIFFKAIIISMCAANLTVIIVSNALIIPLSSIKDVIAGNVEICVVPRTLTLVKDLHQKRTWKLQKIGKHRLNQ